MNVPKLRFKEFTGEWEEKSLGEVTKSQGGKALEKFVSEQGTHKFISIGNYSSESKYFDNGSRVVLNDETCKQLLSKDDLVMILNDKTSEGNIIGRTLLIESDDLYVYNQRSQKIVCEDDVLPKYLYFYANGVLRNQIIKNSQGATQIYINFPVVEKMSINLPSIDEQEKIGLFMEYTDEKIVNQKTIIESLEKQKKGLMQKIFSQELRFKDDDGKEFPAWEEKKLGEVVKVYDGTHQTPNYVDSGVKFVSVEDIRCLYGSNKFITVEEFGSNFKVYPQKGDILMTRIGDIGTAALVDGDEPIAYYVSLALMKPFGVLGKFLLQYIRSNTFQHELWRRTLHIAFPKKINKNEIGECLVMVPCKREQEKIAELLSSYDEKIEIEKKSLEKWQQIKKGLLQQMFV